MSRAIDLNGQVFNRWTVLGRGPRPAGVGSLDYSEKAWWQCRCLCGTERPVVGEALRKNASRSCGCLRAESNRRRARRT